MQAHPVYINLERKVYNDLVLIGEGANIIGQTRRQLYNRIKRKTARGYLFRKRLYVRASEMEVLKRTIIKRGNTRSTAQRIHSLRKATKKKGALPVPNPKVRTSHIIEKRVMDALIEVEKDTGHTRSWLINDMLAKNDKIKAELDKKKTVKGSPSPSTLNSV